MQNSPAHGPDREPGALDAMETGGPRVGEAAVGAAPTTTVPSAAHAPSAPSAPSVDDATVEIDLDDALESTVVLDLEEAHALLGDADGGDAGDDDEDLAGAFAERAAARPRARSSALRLAHATLRHGPPPPPPPRGAAPASPVDDAPTAVHLRARGAGAPMPVTPPVSLRPGDLRDLAAVERAAVAILDAGVPPATSIEAAYRRKERELRALFEPLGPGAAELLHGRLVAARPGDPLATRFHRLVADRRLRLLAFLAEAPRRAALARARGHRP